MLLVGDELIESLALLLHLRLGLSFIDLLGDDGLGLALDELEAAGSFLLGEEDALLIDLF